MAFKRDSKKTQHDHLTPQIVAQALRESIETMEPTRHESDLLTWGRTLGLEVELRKALDPEWTPRRYSVTEEILQDLPLSAAKARKGMRLLVSKYPELMRETEEAVGKLQRWWLKRQAEKLEACGTTWRGHVVRIFWRDRQGRERLRRQVGIHRCKGAWCPSCGRTRQARISSEVEKLLVLAEDWGLNEAAPRRGTSIRAALSFKCINEA